MVAVADTSVTVPLHLCHNRPFVDLQMHRPAGPPRTARFWVDTGGGAFIVAANLARDLGLRADPPPDEGGGLLCRIPPPAASLGVLPLDMAGVEAFVSSDAGPVLAGTDAEGLLPGHLLTRYRVVSDYPGRTFTLATPGTAPGRGAPLPAPVHPVTGFPRVEVEIDGEQYGLLLDTGASYTMLSRAVVDRLSVRHSDWPRAVGAAGAANMGAGAADAQALMLRLALISLGTCTLCGIGVVSRPEGTFEGSMAPWMTGPIVGALGGNVLSAFRVDVDYESGVTSWEQAGAPDPTDMDRVPLVLQPDPDGGFTVLGLVRSRGREAALTGVDVRSGDRLLAVDGADLAGWTLGRVADALRGTPGAQTRLTLQRHGARLEVRAPVLRLL